MTSLQKKIAILVSFTFSGLLGFVVSCYHHQNLNTSTLPADKHLIQTFHYPALFVKQLAGDPQAGRKIFKEFCATCHGAKPLIDIKAPLIGDKKAWKGRRQLGQAQLLKITINGLGAMPARGGCFECSDEQLRETIKYIINSSS